jgi:nicotinate-nucleotide adenylyltransferase
LRLGVYGGAFDPPHNAHVAMARAAVEQLRLDELRIFPTGNAWHKSRELTPAADRVAMAKIAFGGVPRTVIDEREVRRTGATYTIDTLRELAREIPGVELFLIMGEDQAVAFTTWREWQEVAKAAKLYVARRPSTASGKAPVAFETLQLPSMPESATEIRSLIADGEDVFSLVPPAVASYIASHHLYTQGH